MLTIKPRFTTFEDYLQYNDNSEKLYELFNGELVEVPPESGLNFEIANFLFLKFASLVGYRRVRGHGLELEVRGEPKNRYPDLTIIREEHIQQLSNRNTLRFNVPPSVSYRSRQPWRYTKRSRLHRQKNPIPRLQHPRILDS